ncbi:MAG: methyltransferase domain-containing protein [Pseudomonadota bacterium]
MTEAERTAFFELHKDLPREGPGVAEDVLWAAQTAGLPHNARICDAACGPGDDIGALLDAASGGTVVAVDKVCQFVAQARARHAGNDLVNVYEGEMTEIAGPFDFIWCAGAIYFPGIPAALQAWRQQLAPGGAIAFSQVCWFTDTPSEAARAGWANYADMTDEAGVLMEVASAGFRVVGQRRLSDAAWEAYYTPLDKRIAMLDPEPDTALAQVVDDARAEAALWRAERAAFGYLLCVVRPA